jgi:death-on-curing protein
VDGNKRTGFVLAVLFLELNDQHFMATESNTATTTLVLASGQWDEAAYTHFLRVNLQKA